VKTRMVRRAEKPVMCKAAMDVLKTINMKKLLCPTLFTIDDECMD